jgi:thymidylate synthase ThyX
VMPRIVLAEFNTHRVFSRNSASSRAIPVEKMIERVQTDPFIPLYWGKNQKGMQSGEELSEEEQGRARNAWLIARDRAVEQALCMVRRGVHKQITNRLLEPFLWHTVIVTATEWSNFFAQRCHPDAMPEMRLTAEAMRHAMEASTPRPLDYGRWHRPYLLFEQQSITELSSVDRPLKDTAEANKVSVARCARVSYLQHDGTRSVDKDLELFERLTTGGHWSPFEHVARPINDVAPESTQEYAGWSGNFRGWHQFRKDFPNENR